MIFDVEKLDIPDFRKGLLELEKELEQELKGDPNAAEDVVPLLTSITRLLKELPDIKSPTDTKSKKFLQCIPDLAFVMQCLNPMMEDAEDEIDFEDEEEDNFELLKDEE